MLRRKTASWGSSRRRAPGPACPVPRRAALTCSRSGQLRTPPSAAGSQIYGLGREGLLLPGDKASMLKCARMRRDSRSTLRFVPRRKCRRRCPPCHASLPDGRPLRPTRPGADPRRHKFRGLAVQSALSVRMMNNLAARCWDHGASHGLVTCDRVWVRS